ncbi:ASCH domain-containing protein [Phenylobacterium deserti]|uniref:ASCH domain-containing protein n=1 Tax=Phenylobacterium deserti TaxID=1914756 RepID=A0A328AD85_9CAUL|nr:ASCH domain-containing protein [Phenylobacterium deserti]RAK52732.1 hypothetical protein DJ018_11120 [Phenylobacterium deserti]
MAEDGAGRPRLVLRTTKLSERRLADVDAASAADEGEADQSLSGWRETHRDNLTRNGDFAPDMRLWCERFEIVRVLDHHPRAGTTGA